MSQVFMWYQTTEQLYIASNFLILVKYGLIPSWTNLAIKLRHESSIWPPRVTYLMESRHCTCIRSCLLKGQTLVPPIYWPARYYHHKLHKLNAIWKFVHVRLIINRYAIWRFVHVRLIINRYAIEGLSTSD